MSVVVPVLGMPRLLLQKQQPTQRADACRPYQPKCLHAYALVVLRASRALLPSHLDAETRPLGHTRGT